MFASDAGAAGIVKLSVLMSALLNRQGEVMYNQSPNFHLVDALDVIEAAPRIESAVADELVTGSVNIVWAGLCAR